MDIFDRGRNKKGDTKKWLHDMPIGNNIAPFTKLLLYALFQREAINLIFTACNS